MTTTAQLIQSLIHVSGHVDAFYLNDSDTDDGYFDWSTDTGDGSRSLEVGDDDGNTVQLNLTRDQMVRLQRALTLHLLANPAE